MGITLEGRTAALVDMSSRLRRAGGQEHTRCPPAREPSSPPRRHGAHRGHGRIDAHASLRAPWSSREPGSRRTVNRHECCEE